MMKNSVLILLIILLFSSCNSTRKMGNMDYGSPNLKQELVNDQTFKIEDYSHDKTYGYSQENPVMVGGSAISEGPKNERRFLNALAGSNGEEITYYRLGSCCNFTTKNSGFSNTGLLDKYSISYKGLKKDLVLYLNMYDSDTLKVPVGFQLKK